MVQIKEIVKVDSLAQAYELNQKKSNRILGGMMWIRLGRGRIQTAIDLSNLSLDQIIEEQDNFIIGAMCSLRQLEVHNGLHQQYDGVIKESLKQIVGVQFRNGATIGGSIYGRYGFSDILTIFLVLGGVVKLYEKGFVPLKEYIKMPYDRDIIEYIQIPKDNRKCSYESFRLTKTDFPVLTCGVTRLQDTWNIAIGARPGRALIVQEEKKISSLEEAEVFAKELANRWNYESNMRASKEYRQQIAFVLLNRSIRKLIGGSCNED